MPLRLEQLGESHVGGHDLRPTVPKLLNRWQPDL